MWQVKLCKVSFAGQKIPKSVEKQEFSKAR